MENALWRLFSGSAFTSLSLMPQSQIKHYPQQWSQMIKGQPDHVSRAAIGARDSSVDLADRGRCILIEEARFQPLLQVVSEVLMRVVHMPPWLYL
jgi:hypothetical protein